MGTDSKLDLKVSTVHGRVPIEQFQSISDCSSSNHSRKRCSSVNVGNLHEGTVGSGGRTGNERMRNEMFFLHQGI